MRSKIVYPLFISLLLVGLSGCGHYEPSFLSPSSADSATQPDGTVDVSGVNDPVNSQQVRVHRIPFPLSEYRYLKRSGHSTVTGRIAFTHDGRTLPGKKSRLYLNPVTSYSNQWYRESYLGKHRMTPSDPRLYNYLKFTTATSRGTFAFYGVPAGEYYLVGTVNCPACGRRNIRIARKISVRPSQTLTVTLDTSL